MHSTLTNDADLSGQRSMSRPAWKKDLYYRSRLYVRKPWLLWTKNIRTSIYILSWRNVFMSRSGADLSVIVLTSNLHYSIISWRKCVRLSPPREILHRMGAPFVHHLAYLSTWAATHFNSARLVQSPRGRRWRGWTNVPWNTCVPYFSIYVIEPLSLTHSDRS